MCCDVTSIGVISPAFWPVIWLQVAEMITPADLELVSLFLKNTKSSLWVWTMLERRPSCTSCKWTCGVGKILFSAASSILTFYSPVDSLTKEAVQTSPTIGSNVEQITVRKTHFLVWDIGGQESLRASWYSYYCNTEVPKHIRAVFVKEKRSPAVLSHLHLSDCHPGGGQHRPRTPQPDQRGAPPNALARGTDKPSVRLSLRLRLCALAANCIQPHLTQIGQFD